MTNDARMNDFSGIEKEEKKNNIGYLTLGFCLLFSTINGALRCFSFYFLGDAAVGSYFAMVAWGVVLLRYLFVTCHETRKKIILSMVLYSLFLLLNYLLFTSTRRYYSLNWDDLLRFVIIGFPGAVLISQTTDFPKLFDKIRPLAWVAGAMICFAYLLGGVDYFGYMEWGNRIIPIFLIQTLTVFYSRKPGDIVLFIVILAFSLLGGRQSLVIVIIALLLAVALWKKNKALKTISIFALFVVLLCLLLFWEQATNALNSIITTFNIDSRSLTKLIEGDLLEDSNRNFLYSVCRDLIKENGISVSGIFTDRVQLTALNLGSKYCYAHNFIYEFLMDFGVLFGGILSIFIVGFLLVKLFRCKREYLFLYIIMILFGLARIWVSSSIFVYGNFVILMGFASNKEVFLPSKFRIKIN